MQARMHARACAPAHTVIGVHVLPREQMHAQMQVWAFMHV